MLMLMLMLMLILVLVLVLILILIVYYCTTVLCEAVLDASIKPHIALGDAGSQGSRTHGLTDSLTGFTGIGRSSGISEHWTDRRSRLKTLAGVVFPCCSLLFPAAPSCSLLHAFERSRA
jgi:hypothetical protein